MQSAQGEITPANTETASIDYKKDILSHLFMMFFGLVNYEKTIHIELIILYIIYFILLIPFISTCYILFLLIEATIAQAAHACRFLRKPILWGK